MFTVPVTRGSRMKLRPVCWPTVLMTDWMSALTKLTVIFSSSAAKTADEASAAARTRNLRNVRNELIFIVDLISDFTSRIDRVRKLYGRAAALDFGLHDGEGGELLVEAREVAGTGDRLAVHFPDDVPGLQAELLREASGPSGFHLRAA